MSESSASVMPPPTLPAINSSLALARTSAATISCPSPSSANTRNFFVAINDGTASHRPPPAKHVTTPCKVAASKKLIKPQFSTPATNKNKAAFAAVTMSANRALVSTTRATKRSPFTATHPHTNSGCNSIEGAVPVSPCFDPDGDLKLLQSQLASLPSVTMRNTAITAPSNHNANSDKGSDDSLWEQRSATIVTSHRLVVHYPHKLLSPVFMSVVKLASDCASSLRSQQVSLALGLIKQLALVLINDREFRQYINDAVQSLLPNITPIAVQSGGLLESKKSCYQILWLVVNHLSPLKILLYYSQTRYSQSKNKAEKMLSACYMHQSLVALARSTSVSVDECPSCQHGANQSLNAAITQSQTFSTQPLLALASGDLQSLLIALMSLHNDGLKATRLHAKGSLAILTAIISPVTLVSAIKLMPNFDESEKIQKLIAAITAANANSKTLTNANSRSATLTAPVSKIKAPTQFGTWPANTCIDGAKASTECGASAETSVSAATIVNTTPKSRVSTPRTNTPTNTRNGSSSMVVIDSVMTTPSAKLSLALPSTTTFFSYGTARPSIFPYNHERGLVSPMSDADAHTHNGIDTSYDISPLPMDPLLCDNEPVAGLPALPTIDQCGDSTVVRILESVSGSHSRSNSEDDKSTLPLSVSEPVMESDALSLADELAQCDEKIEDDSDSGSGNISDSESEPRLDTIIELSSASDSESTDRASFTKPSLGSVSISSRHSDSDINTDASSGSGSENDENANTNIVAAVAEIDCRASLKRRRDDANETISVSVFSHSHHSHTGSVDLVNVPTVDPIMLPTRQSTVDTVPVAAPVAPVLSDRMTAIDDLTASVQSLILQSRSERQSLREALRDCSSAHADRQHFVAKLETKLNDVYAKRNNRKTKY